MATKVVPFIPGDALTSAYDDEPKAYGQAGLPNVIDPARTEYKDCCVGTYIYRSVGDDYQTKIPYQNHIKGFSELNAGAHYYVMSGYSDQHSKASVRVHISELDCNLAGNRVGYISLSIVTGGTIMKQCDIGLKYRATTNGYGWFPYSWARNWLTKGDGVYPYLGPENFDVQDQHASTALTKGDIAEIEIEVWRARNNDYVTGTIYKVVTNGNQEEKIKFAQVKYKKREGCIFVLDHTQPYLRFTRFMSLVPINADCKTEDGQDSVYCTDYADGSTLKGVMRDCKIDGQPWDKSKIAFAWSMQTANIKTLKISQLTSPSAGADVDEFEVEHATQTHGTPFYKN